MTNNPSVEGINNFTARSLINCLPVRFSKEYFALIPETTNKSTINHGYITAAIVSNMGIFMSIGRGIIIVLFATPANADTWEQIKVQNHAVSFPHGAGKADIVWGRRQWRKRACVCCEDGWYAIVLFNPFIYNIDVRRESKNFLWTDRHHSSSGEWSGNVFDFYFRVYNKMMKDIKAPFKMQGGFRMDDTPIHRAFGEALANCIIKCFYV